MGAERNTGSASLSHEASAPKRQAAASRTPERSPQLASDLLRRGATASAGLAATLASADVPTRAAAVAGLQRSHGNLAVQRLLAAQREEQEAELGYGGFGGGSDSAIGYALPEDYSSAGFEAGSIGYASGSGLGGVIGGGAGPALGGSLGNAAQNPMARIWNGIAGARDAWSGGKSEALGEGFSALSGAAKQYGKGTRGAVNDLIGGFGEAGEALWNGPAGGGDSLEEDVVSRLGAAGSALGGGIGSAAEKFGGGVIGAGSQLWGGAQNVAGSLWGGATGAAGELGSAAGDVWDYFTD